MGDDSKNLLAAVRLLDAIIDDVKESGISSRSRGSSGVLLARLKRLRAFLLSELRQPEPNWRGYVAPLLREAARWLGEYLANNIQYQLRPRIGGHEGIDREDRICA